MKKQLSFLIAVLIISLSSLFFNYQKVEKQDLADSPVVINLPPFKITNNNV